MRELQENGRYDVERHHTTRGVVIVTTFTTTVATLAGAYFGIQYLFLRFPWLIFVALSVLIIVIFAVPVLLLLMLLKVVVRPSFRDITQYGLAHSNLIGQIGVLAPLTASTSKTSSIKGKLGLTKVEMVMPTFVDAVKNYVRPDNDEYFLGFDFDAIKNRQTIPVFTEETKTSIITGGKSGVGKTRFELTIIFQFIYKNKIVVVCDGHYKKPDGLNSLLVGLEEYCVLCRSSKQLYEATVKFREEMEYRKQLEPQIIEQLPEVVLVLEELRAIYHDTILGDDEKEYILETIEKTDVEYRGYGGRCYVTSQSFKAQDVGSTNFRSQVGNKYILKMEKREASYITEEDAIATKISKLPKRTVLYLSDEIDFGEEKHAAIVEVPNGIGRRLAAILRMRGYPTLSQRIANMLQVEQSSLLGAFDNTLISNPSIPPKRQIAPSKDSANKQEDTMNTLDKPFHTDELLTNSQEEMEETSELMDANISTHEQTKQAEWLTEEYKDDKGKTVYYRVKIVENGRLVETETKKFLVTDFHIQEVVNAYANVRLGGVEPSRRNIMEHLHAIDKNTWNNGKWYFFAYICYYKNI